MRYKSTTQVIIFLMFVNRLHWSTSGDFLKARELVLSGLNPDYLRKVAAFEEWDREHKADQKGKGDKTKVDLILRSLANDEERAIVRYKFGLDGFKPRSVNEIAQLLHRSWHWVNENLKRILQELGSKWDLAHGSLLIDKNSAAESN